MKFIYTAKSTCVSVWSCSYRMTRSTSRPLRISYKRTVMTTHSNNNSNSSDVPQVAAAAPWRHRRRSATSVRVTGTWRTVWTRSCSTRWCHCCCASTSASLPSSARAGSSRSFPWVSVTVQLHLEIHCKGYMKYLFEYCAHLCHDFCQYMFENNV